MGESLRDQLLKAGLVTRKQAKRAGREQRRGGAAQSTESTKLARRQLAEKQARDRALNEARNAAAQRNASDARCLQLIETHRRDFGDGEIAYHFVDGGKVRRIRVTADLHAQLAAGALAIVRAAGHYELVEAAIADELRRHGPQWVVPPAQQAADNAQQEYPDHQVPDDLMW